MPGGAWTAECEIGSLVDWDEAQRAGVQIPSVGCDGRNGPSMVLDGKIKTIVEETVVVCAFIY